MAVDIEVFFWRNLPQSLPNIFPKQDVGSAQILSKVEGHFCPMLVGAKLLTPRAAIALVE